MRIGIIAEGRGALGVQYEGIWRVLRLLLQAITRHNHNIVIFCECRHAAEVATFCKACAAPAMSVAYVVLDAILPASQSTAFQEADDFAENLAEMVLLSETEIDVWLNPNPFWTAVQYVTGPKLSLFHDFVFHDYPASYFEEDYSKYLDIVAQAGRVIDKFVCFSSYVRRRHAIEACGIAPEKIDVIVTPPIDYSSIFDPELVPVRDDRRLAQRYLADSLTRSLPLWQGDLERFLFLHHIVNYPFADADYIFVSTQNRPHKSMKTIAEALNDLIRKRFVNISVITTALLSVEGTSALERYLAAEKLFGDFMSLGKLDDLEHALAYTLAKLTVHTSPFEGNFPLPFAESVSMGTPCIVPFSAAYADFIPEQYWDCVFYEDHASALADRIVDVVRHRETVLQQQRALLRVLSENTWEQVAGQYSDLLANL
jgi:glycosyltransferase involved in cell wall biosynthesis